jgi:hypothetical protein
VKAARDALAHARLRGLTHIQAKINPRSNRQRSET